jgi:hypothetical protein
MNNFNNDKRKRAEGRSIAQVEARLRRSESRWISELLHKRYDAILREPLPDSFVTLLDELEGKSPDRQPN